jgi:cellulose biosynthesis protein BcsQ
MLQQRDPDSLSVALDLWAELPPSLVFESVIPRDPIFLRSATAGVPIALLRRQTPPMARVFDRLAEEVEHRLRPRPFPENEKDDEDSPVSLFA